VAGYLEHERLAHAETAPERFFMNVALARALYAHALVAAPRLALVRDGSPIYAWPYEKRHVWRAPHMPFRGRVLERVTRAR
jgi:hypothetical protein